MAYRDIQYPIVGAEQIERVNKSDTYVNLKTYLEALSGNIVASHGDQSPIIVNGVTGESMTIPLLTTSNAVVINGLATYMQPVVFPTAGTISKTFTTSEHPGVITAVAEATFINVAVQANVQPALFVKIEMQVGSFWQLLQGFDSNQNILAGNISVTAIGQAYSIGLFYIQPDIRPNTTYRVTLMAGHYSGAALPNTGQWKIDASGSNYLEFNAWSGA